MISYPLVLFRLSAATRRPLPPLVGAFWPWRWWGLALRNILEVPLSQLTGFSQLLPWESANNSAFPFPLTVVGRREDDNNLRGRASDGKREASVPDRESFHSFFEKESCPAIYVWGSQFYSFQGPAASSPLWYTDKSMRMTRLELQTLMQPPLHQYLSLAIHSQWQKGAKEWMSWRGRGRGSLL